MARTQTKAIRPKAERGSKRKDSGGQSALSSAAHPTSSPVLEEIFHQTRAPGFKDYLAKLLVELCEINTTPNPDVAVMRRAEEGCFRILERELGALQHAGARLERRPMNPAIQSHANYSLLHFTKTAARPEGLSAEEVYANRSNLLYIVPAEASEGEGKSIALNAHIDVVAPYFPPRVEGRTVFGRGSCDDKGPVVGIVAALKVLSVAMAKAGLKWNRNVVAMFVVEEETGGNGSLSLAIDRELKRMYDSALVSECTGLKIHPANRGAVWYRAQLRAPRGISAFEMYAFINEEMEKEGAAIRAESRHPLFPQRPVQTCHGIIGPFGEHPSRICGHLKFTIEFEHAPGRAISELVQDCLDAGLAGYVGMYGDKTAVIDPATGKAMVARHYDLRPTDEGFEVEVYGAPGHMGSIRERDGAITKAAYLVRSLISSRSRLQKAGGKMTLQVSGMSETENELVLEGGQGFVPTHTIEEVMDRLRRATERGAETYLRLQGRTEHGKDVVTVTYEKLHNVAFDGDAASPSMLNAIEAARVCGFWDEQPVLGWTVSCDARLFATEHPGMPVLTFGPGQLVHAHSDHEQINLDEIRAAAEFIAVHLLLETGSIPPIKAKR
ncbi:MAG TPA: M20/M25/M40 family metallo-hydrolase [Patescibacteria group bacterium]|nr:M20/M25/M40 family metallo-hydrolase [Patescibacteria group bacterium]